MLNRQEKRAFQRLVSGLTVGVHQKAYYRFLTLTTSRKAAQSVRYKRTKTSNGIFYFPEPYDINKSFDTFKKRVARASQRKDGFGGFKFNRYFKLKTAEGYGVLHIIYWGNFLPQKWISRVWKQIHASPVVYIEACRGNGSTDVKGLVGYLLTDYLTKQPIIRMSYSWRWAWLGLARSWKNTIKNTALLRRSGSIKDKTRWVWNVRHHSTEGEYNAVIPFKLRYRNAVLEYWSDLLKHPLLSTRQIKFCNPSRTKYVKKSGRGRWEWMPSWEWHRIFAVVAPSLPQPVRKTRQCHFRAS